jgi:hypothetical protein
MERVPQASQKGQSRAVSQAACTVADANRSTVTLNMRPGFDTMISHRLGISLAQTFSAGVPATYGLGR